MFVSYAFVSQILSLSLSLSTFLGVDSPFFSTIVLSKISPGFQRRFSRKIRIPGFKMEMEDMSRI